MEIDFDYCTDSIKFKCSWKEVNWNAYHSHLWWPSILIVCEGRERITSVRISDTPGCVSSRSYRSSKSTSKSKSDNFPHQKVTKWVLPCSVMDEKHAPPSRSLPFVLSSRKKMRSLPSTAFRWHNQSGIRWESCLAATTSHQPRLTSHHHNIHTLPLPLQSRSYRHDVGTQWYTHHADKIQIAIVSTSLKLWHQLWLLILSNSITLFQNWKKIRTQSITLLDLDRNPARK